MMLHSDESRKAIIDKLESHGVSQVRTLIASGNWPTNFMQEALVWLKSKDDEAASLQFLSHSEMAATASRATIAAERAAIAAEVQAKAAEEQARIAHKALTTARFAAWIGAVALVSSLFTYYLQWL